MAKTHAIDLEHLKRYTGGDQELEAEVFAMFKEQVQMWMRLLQPDADAQSWASAAHSLKGTARSIGAHALAQACGTAESLSAAGPTARSIAAQEVRHYADEALNFIDTHTYKLRLQALRNSSKRENS